MNKLIIPVFLIASIFPACTDSEKNFLESEDAWFGLTSPGLTPDGKYLFFLRHTETQDIFWVSTEVIEELRTKLN